MISELPILVFAKGAPSGPDCRTFPDKKLVHSNSPKLFPKEQNYLAFSGASIAPLVNAETSQFINGIMSQNNQGSNDH